MTNLSQLTKPLPPKLPESREQYLALRKGNMTRTLNDMVEEIHLSLANNETYENFLYAVYPEQAQEGSLTADNLEAASMIREEAKKRRIDAVAREKKATIAKALGVVLRRFGQTRDERRRMVEGEIVPGQNENGGE
jgi:hypothetical protein